MKRFAVILILLMPLYGFGQLPMPPRDRIMPSSWFHGEDCQHELYDTATNTSLIINLMGRVKVVKTGGMIKVKQVDYSDADLLVRPVDTVLFCGDWHFVDSGERFTVQYVEDDSWDFRIHILTPQEVKDYMQIIIYQDR